MNWPVWLWLRNHHAGLHACEGKGFARQAQHIAGGTARAEGTLRSGA